MFAFCLIVLLLSGCTLGPDFKPPELALANEWMAAGQNQILGKPLDPIEWWRVFDDPVLNSLVAQAHTQNLTLQAAALRIVQARTVRSGAFWTQFPAILGPNASYTDTHFSRNVDPSGEVKRDSLQVLSNGQRVPQPRDDRITLPRLSPALPLVQVTFPELGFVKSVQIYQAGFDALWELDIWGQKRRLIEAASASYQVAVAHYDDVLVSLTAEVAAVYIELRTLEERLDALREAITLLEQFYSTAEDHAHRAQGTDLDVEMANTLLTDAKASIPALESARRVAENTLCVLLATPPQDLPPELHGTSTPIPTAPTEVAVGIPADLLRRRPDVRMAEFAAWAECARIGVAKGKLFPSFSLLGAIGLASSHTSDFFDDKSFRSIYGINFHWNPLLYPITIEGVRFQDAKFQESIAEYKEMVLRAAMEVEDACVRFLGAQNELDLLTTSAAASRRAADLALDQYRRGTLQYPGAVEAFQYLVQQQDRAILTRSAVTLNLVAIYKALGGGWQISREKPLLPDDVREQMQQRTDWWTFTGKGAIAPQEFKAPDLPK